MKECDGNINEMEGRIRYVRQIKEGRGKDGQEKEYGKVGGEDGRQSLSLWGYCVAWEPLRAT